MVDVMVNPFTRVVANGPVLDEDGNPTGALRATLIVTPFPSEQGQLKLANWPSEMAKYIREMGDENGGEITLKLYAQGAIAKFDEENDCYWAPKVGDSPQKPIIAIVRQPNDQDTSNINAFTLEADWNESARLWKKSFCPENEDDTKPWIALESALKNSLMGGQSTAVFEEELKTVDGKKMDKKGAIEVDRPDPDKTTTIKSVIPIKHSELAWNQQFSRAASVATLLGSKPHFMPSDIDKTDEKFVIAKKDDDYDADAALKSKRIERLKTANEELNTERQKSFKLFHDTVGNLASAACLTDEDVLQFDEINTDLAGTPANLTSTLASQEYGTALQVARKTDPNDSKKVREEKEKKIEDQKSVEETLQIFYAFQADPAIARLMALNIDLEIPKEEVQKLWLLHQEPKDEGFFFLSSMDENTDVELARAWTCAKLRKSSSPDISYSFLPAPRMEVVLDPKLNEASRTAALCSLEQFDGVALVGRGWENQKPAMDIISLDVRRAAQGAVDQEKPIAEQAADGRQNFLTAGLVIVDRSRSLRATLAYAKAAADQQAARDNENDRGNVILYAEELTVGWRLDTSLARKPGEDPWRSLGTKIVSYINNEWGQKFLDRLIGRWDGARRAQLETATIQPGARHIPWLDDGDKAKQDVEAVVDEAITLWDGSPMAVDFTPEGQTMLLPVDEIKEPVPRLPFTKAYYVPSSSKKDKGGRLLDHRIPPLRFGEGYRFGMTAVYLGGGGHSIEQSSDCYNGKGFAKEVGKCLCLPPLLDENNLAASAKRFLRNESVGSPQILMPRDVAKRRDGPMGFESSAIALLRPPVTDEVVIKGNNDDKEDVVRGRPYVKLSERQNPSYTVRVFVPPTVSEDEASRHSVFDPLKFKKDPPSALNGVRYNPERGGFPSALPTKAKTFNDDEALLYRTIGQSDSELQGPSVFMSNGGKKTRGFIPDPMAQIMVVRLRHPETGIYLKGHIEIDLYPADDKSYIKLKPLVVSFAYSNELRETADIEFDDVVREDLKKNLFYNGEGLPGKKGVRVSHLIVTLAPGEDFELDICCRPQIKQLAQQFAVIDTMATRALELSGKPTELKDYLGDAAEKIQTVLDTDAGGAAGMAGIAGRTGPSKKLLTAMADCVVKSLQQNAPIEHISSVISVRSTHAVAKPLYDPEWLRKDTSKLVVGTETLLGFQDEDFPDRFFGDPGLFRPEPVIPTYEPDVGDPDKSHLVLEPLRVDTVRDKLKELKNEVGSNSYQLTGSVFVDLQSTSALEVIASTVLPSSSVFDDVRKRRSLKNRRKGAWPQKSHVNGEQSPFSTREVFGFKVDEFGRVDLPRSEVILMRADELQHPQQRELWPRNGVMEEVSLALLHYAARAGGELLHNYDGEGKKIVASIKQAHEFRDGKARRMFLKVRAISRFADRFVTAERYREEKGPQIALRQPLLPKDQSRTSQWFTTEAAEETEISDAEIWLPATIRPVKCEIVSAIPSFRFDTFKCIDEGIKKSCVTRNSLVRLYFKRGWFSSGEGERVGIVIWPPNLFDHTLHDIQNDMIRHSDGRKMKLHDFQDSDLGPGGAFVTRWGADPIRKSHAPQKAVFMPPSAFGDFHTDDGTAEIGSPHDPRFVPNVLIPIRQAEETQIEDSDDLRWFKASLLTYEPCFDVDREQWYVDVSIVQAAVSDPFVRFGLVRYQEQAIADDLKVSEPVVSWAQVLPRREASVYTEKSDDDNEIVVNLQVTGQASDGIRELPVLPDILCNEDLIGDQKKEREEAASKHNAICEELLKRPRIRMTLFHEHVLDDGRYVRQLVDTQKPPLIVNYKLEQGHAHWHLRQTVSRQRLKELGKGDLIVMAEEIETRMPASYENEPIKVADLFDEKTLRESGPRFAARIKVPVEITAESKMEKTKA